MASAFARPPGHQELSYLPPTTSCPVAQWIPPFLFLLLLGRVPLESQPTQTRMPLFSHGSWASEIRKGRTSMRGASLVT